MEGTRLSSQAAGLLGRLRTPFSAYRRGRPPFGEYEEARYLPSGDRYLLVEFGDRLDIIVNCKALALGKEIKKSKIPGILETCVGQLAVLIFYDDLIVSFYELVATLKDIKKKKISSTEETVLPSSLIEIPVAFHEQLIQLAHVGDRIRFYAIGEEEYFQIEKEVQEGTYRYRITSYDLFSMRKYLEFLEEVREDSEMELRKRPWSGGAHHV